MTRRQTLSERFDSLSPPKYEDMQNRGRYENSFDGDDNRPNGNTVFTVVNGNTRNFTSHRDQRISHVAENMAPHFKYQNNRATAGRPFRRELNPNPYSSFQSRPFQTNRFHAQQHQYHYQYQHQQQQPQQRIQANPRYTNYNSNSGYGQRFNNNNSNNLRLASTRGRGVLGGGGGWRDSVMRGNANMRGFQGPIAATTASTRGGFVNRGRGRGRAGVGAGLGVGVGTGVGGRGRGRGGRSRGDMNKGRNIAKKNNPTQQQLDKELERYYAVNDPEKLKEMKNDELDREMDAYWTQPQEEAPKQAPTEASANNVATKSEESNKNKKSNNEAPKPTTTAKKTKVSANEKTTDKDF